MDLKFIRTLFTVAKLFFFLKIECRNRGQIKLFSRFFFNATLFIYNFLIKYRSGEYSNFT